MDDVIDKRLTDLESLFADLPDLLNIRMERIDKALKANEGRFDEMAGRLNLLDKQMGMIVRDVRDLRNGVMAMFAAQDKEISGIRADVSGQNADISTLKADVSTIKADVAELKADVTELKAGIAEILRRLPAG
jgi:archaellum component FlaC